MSLAGSARAAPCRDVDGIASSRILPLSVVNCQGKDNMTLKNTLQNVWLEISVQEECVLYEFEVSPKTGL